MADSSSQLKVRSALALAGGFDAYQLRLWTAISTRLKEQRLCDILQIEERLRALRRDGQLEDGLQDGLVILAQQQRLLTYGNLSALRGSLDLDEHKIASLKFGEEDKRFWEQKSGGIQPNNQAGLTSHYWNAYCALISELDAEVKARG